MRAYQPRLYLERARDRMRHMQAVLDEVERIRRANEYAEILHYPRPYPDVEPAIQATLIARLHRQIQAYVGKCQYWSKRTRLPYWWCELPPPLEEASK